MSSRYLAIDFGLKHLGVAIATGPLAEPLTHISYHQPEKALTALQDLCQTHHIDHIIMGLSEGHMAQLTQQFGAKLQKHLQLPLTYHDETLSSQEADRYLRQAQAKKKKRQNAQHQTAAAIILQDFLDHQKPATILQTA